MKSKIKKKRKMSEKLPKVRKLPSESTSDGEEDQQYHSDEEEEKKTNLENENVDFLREHLKKTGLDPVFADCADDSIIKFLMHRNIDLIHEEEFREEEQEEDMEEEKQEVDTQYSIPGSPNYIQSERVKLPKRKVGHPKWGKLHRCVPIHILENLPKDVQDKILEGLHKHVSFSEICDNLVIPNMGSMMELYTHTK